MQQCEWITDLIKKYLLNGVHKKGIQRNNHIVELSINYTNWTTIQTTNSVTSDEATRQNMHKRYTCLENINNTKHSVDKWCPSSL